MKTIPFTYPWPRPTGPYAAYQTDGPVAITHVGVPDGDGAPITFMVVPTGASGGHTGRTRYHVDCVTCNIGIHEATTGPTCRIEEHMFEAHNVKIERADGPTTYTCRNFDAWGCTRDEGGDPVDPRSCRVCGGFKEMHGSPTQPYCGAGDLDRDFSGDPPARLARAPKPVPAVRLDAAGQASLAGEVSAPLPWTLETVAREVRTALVHVRFHLQQAIVDGKVTSEKLESMLRGVARVLDTVTAIEKRANGR